MLTVDVPLDRRGRSAVGTASWLGRRLSLVVGTGLVAADATLVLAAFWVRFIAPDQEATALGLDEYARMGAIVSLVTVVLFALHDFYDLDRPRSWLGRLQLVVSTVSILPPRGSGLTSYRKLQSNHPSAAHFARCDSLRAVRRCRQSPRSFGCHGQA